MILGIDVGGTFVKMGVVRGRRIFSQRVLETCAFSASPRALQDALVQASRDFMRRHHIGAVGVGVPGLVRYPQGIVDSCANLPGWRAVPLRANLIRRLGVPVVVDNDVHAMTLAEWRFGAGDGARNLLCLTLGTGVGGGLVLNGELYRSRLGPAAEVGHVPLGEWGPRCACGGRACLERYVGNRQILAQVRRRIRAGQKTVITRLAGGDPARITPEIIDEACRRGDRFARGVWKRAGERIGLALVDVVNLLCPDRIVIGGGIARAGHWLFGAVRRTVRERAMRGLEEVPIVPASLGGSAGLIGAALLAQEAGRDSIAYSG